MITTFLKDITHHINVWMIDAFGIVLALRLQEALTYLSGMLLGGIIVLFISGMIAHHIIIDHELKTPAMLRVVKGGKMYMIVNPKGVMQSIDVIYCLILWKVMRKSDEGITHLLHNRARLRVMLFILLTLAILLILIGFLFSMDVIPTDGKRLG